MDRKYLRYSLRMIQNEANYLRTQIFSNTGGFLRAKRQIDFCIEGIMNQCNIARILSRNIPGGTYNNDINLIVHEMENISRILSIDINISYSKMDSFSEMENRINDSFKVLFDSLNSLFAQNNTDETFFGESLGRPTHSHEGYTFNENH